MAAGFDLSAYACAHPPRHLWRVTHPGSQSRRDDATLDLVAADGARALASEADVKTAVRDHVVGLNRRPSCFLSAFADEHHARRWAKQRAGPDYAIVLLEIDTALLTPDALVFALRGLAGRLGISCPYADDEFLILRRIPIQAQVREMDLAEMLGKGARSLPLPPAPALSGAAALTPAAAAASERAAAHFTVPRWTPGERWAPDPCGHYDSDDESDYVSDDRLMSDDMVRLIEGTWEYNY
ncbi:hypothetical protein S40285_09996 [Stachybotrys chlorohalonatus IBT 40285]|uniref:DUF7587 domain-containing protein n=1 Tax=Stachybotrys chlorohalonatus (strain IBT 40285) TaxID=1283841 RepID=A0A084R0V3_STAC4|nr:hypothetical protein S40285_09996 [Stachybotrys chlorohalonata IBT 40285]